MSETIKYNMPEETGKYMLEVMAAVQSNPELRRLLDAAHHVLAGGSAKVEIVAEGDSARVAELAAIRDAGLARTNAINAAAGTYVTIMA